MNITENNRLKKRIIVKYFFKENCFSLFLLPAFIFLQLLILYLDVTETESVFYMGIVSCTFLIIFFIVKFIFYYRENIRYCNFLEYIEIHSENIPFCDEYSYYENSLSLPQMISIERIEKINLEKESAIYENRKRIIEQNDYFSLWIHQIKTPITSINVLLQNMNFYDDKIFQIQRALLNIDNYTQMALHYLKLQNSDTNLHLIECNLNDILQNIFRKYRSIFIYKAVELRYTDCNLKIVGDPVLFEVMIEQLISNSLKYCGIDGKKGIITVYAEARTPISLIIEDNGIGIAASDLPKIFDKGYSGLNGRLSEKTTGLGLYLAKTIAERLNCTISIDSAQNEWTKAVIKIIPSKVIRN